jgi:hypothetical protein
MTPSLLAQLKNLLTKYVLSGEKELQTITRGVLESWGSVPNEVTASTATTLIDLNLSPFVVINLQESTTLSFTGSQTGVYVLKIKQGSVGSKTITWPSNIKWPEATEPTLTTTANAWDFVTLVYDGTYFSGTSTLNFVA